MRNLESEQEIIRFIESGQHHVGPVSFCLATQPVERMETEPSLVLQATWGEDLMLLPAEVDRYGSDKAVMQAANSAQYYADCMKPLVIVPWLSEEQRQIF